MCTCITSQVERRASASVQHLHIAKFSHEDEQGVAVSVVRGQMHRGRHLLPLRTAAHEELAAAIAQQVLEGVGVARGRGIVQRVEAA